MVGFDFFCGAGGLTRGLLDSGIEVLAGIDVDDRLQLTYESNNEPSQFICEDIRDIDILELRDDVGITDSDVVLYAACCPCQPFSTLNQATHDDDDQKALIISFAELVVEAPPDFILVENVPGLNNAYGDEIFERFLNIIALAGFARENMYAAELDAQDFGVPQVRKRFILLASRHGPMVPPRRSPYKPTVRDVLTRYPRIADGARSTEYLNHETRQLQPHHKTIVKAVPKNGGSRRDIIDTSILLECHRRNPSAHKDVFGRMAWDEPAPTLTCRCIEVYCGRFIHPRQNRGISLREAAAIQTFPDDYEFFGTFFHIAKQIGNAVPVRFGKSLGTAIQRSVSPSHLS
jgi:DNA (cytosine-5)-methyltransferase 1